MVQYYELTYTVGLNSDMFRWRSPLPSSGEKHHRPKRFCPVIHIPTHTVVRSFDTQIIRHHKRGRTFRIFAIAIDHLILEESKQKCVEMLYLGDGCYRAVYNISYLTFLLSGSQNWNALIKNVRSYLRHFCARQDSWPTVRSSCAPTPHTCGSYSLDPTRNWKASATSDIFWGPCWLSCLQYKGSSCLMTMFKPIWRCMHRASSYNIYKPTRCTKFLWLDFIFH